MKFSKTVLCLRKIWPHLWKFPKVCMKIGNSTFQNFESKFLTNSPEIFIDWAQMQTVFLWDLGTRSRYLIQFLVCNRNWTNFHLFHFTGLGISIFQQEAISKANFRVRRININLLFLILFFRLRVRLLFLELLQWDDFSEFLFSLISDWNLQHWRLEDNQSFNILILYVHFNMKWLFWFQILTLKNWIFFQKKMKIIEKLSRGIRMM